MQGVGTPHKRKHTITKAERFILYILDNFQLKPLKEFLTHALKKNIASVDSAIEQPDAQGSAKLLKIVLGVKHVEGCSEKMLHYYQTTIAKLLHTIDKRVMHISTDDLCRFSSFSFVWRTKNIFLKALSGKFTRICTNKPFQQFQIQL